MSRPDPFEPVLEVTRSRDELAIHRARAQLFARQPSRPWRWAVGFGVVAAFALAAFQLSWGRSAAPIGFRVEGREPSGHEEWVASNSESLSLAFDDGSRVQLDPESEVEVTNRTDRGARIRVGRGRVLCDVRHREDTAWTFVAGPYEARVIGTRFSMRWDPERQALALEVTEGAVEVRGPELDPTVVRAGRELRVEVRDPVTSVIGAPHEEPSVEANTAETTPSVGSDTAALRETTEVEGRARERPATPSREVGEPPAVTPDAETVDYRAWVREGRFDDVLARADVLGWDAAVTSGEPWERIALGDAARLRGRTADARAAYLRALEAGDPSVSSRAAFELGRLDFEADPGRGATWFRQALTERPDGPFSREAAGRLIECESRAGHGPAARLAAQAYLDRYPTGPHAALARSLVESE